MVPKTLKNNLKKIKKKNSVHNSISKSIYFLFQMVYSEQ